MEVSEIGPAIRAAREAEGMSQHDLAQRTGVWQGCISGYERGERFPAAAPLCALAEVLPGLPLAEMLEAEHRHQAEVRKKRSSAIAKSHARKRAAKEAAPKPPRPRKYVRSLTPAQKLAAVTWAANQAGMSYGQFVAQTGVDEYPGIYDRFRRGLEAIE